MLVVRRELCLLRIEFNAFSSMLTICELQEVRINRMNLIFDPIAGFAYFFKMSNRFLVALRGLLGCPRFDNSIKGVLIKRFWDTDL